MKRFILLTLALTMLLTLAACGKGSSGAAGANGTDAAMLPGKLAYINLKDGDKPVIRGLFLAGNQAGSTEFNTGDPATEGIRCIFELNEWVEIYLDSDIKEGLQVWVFEHKKDQSFYADAQFSDETPGFKTVCDLAKEEVWGMWASFYLNTDDTEPGLYDLVFTYKGKAVASFLTRFYKIGDLGAKTDEELKALMSKIAD